MPWSQRNWILVGTICLCVLQNSHGQHAAWAADNTALPADQVEFFEQKVRPLLIEKCLSCHSFTQKLQGNLSLDSREGWQKGGDTGPAILPEKPEESLLIKAVRYTDPDLKMPPTAKLSDTEIAVLEQWVRLGAPDPREVVSTPLPKQNFDPDIAKAHWAYQPLQNVALPPVQNAAWPVNEIDHFVLSALEQRGFQPAADADRPVWLRRVTLDLTGLPPSPAEVTTFLSDTSEHAPTIVVDRLLGTRAFGERWARAWLDLVGYADQIGSANNVPADYAWRYRDYVVQSFEQDKPYDVFIREQIAGDLISAKTIEERQAQLTATGFLVLGNINIVEGDKLVLQMDLVDQQVEKIGKTFLGMTLNCVRCHDHKFDPITQRDYYGLAGILANAETTYTTNRGIWSTVTGLPLPETLDQFSRREAALKVHDQQVSTVASEKVTTEKELKAVQTQLVEAADSAKEELTKQQGQLQGKLKTLEQKLWHLNYLKPNAPVAFGVKEGPKITDTHMQVRGNPHVPGELVPRGFVAIATHGPVPEIPREESGRRQLADWLTSSAQPLVARTAVNRVWQKLLGRGLVNSVDYFGLRSEPPSHPELLDHLSLRFIQRGWSLKQLIREIVLSRTYRQSSEVTANAHAALTNDPDNVWLWRMTPRRLEAEMLRDAVLFTAGTLKPSTGGPALAPEFPENVGGLDPKDVNPISFSLNKFRAEQSFIRTIYLPVVRSSDQRGPADVLNFFDFPQPALLTGNRPTTSVSSQALFLLNGPLFKDAAQQISTEFREKRAAEPLTERLQSLGLKIWNRPLNPVELESLQGFLTLATAADGENVAWLQLVQALLISNEFLFRL